MSLQPEATIESRRVRFESIEGLQRRDIGLASEIWLRDICQAKWATPEVMKIAAHLVRYIVTPDARQLSMARIEHQLQLPREEAQAALRLLRIYRAIEAFSITGEELRVAMHLTTLQRLATLDARHRLEYLTRQFAPRELHIPGSSHWVPELAADDAGASRASDQRVAG